ncbi:MAG: hypothetical protein JWR21_3194 [Herminiimonas sp.]|nr:hypothetical protein [Herminiimonas sp.]
MTWIVLFTVSCRPVAADGRMTRFASMGIAFGDWCRRSGSGCLQRIVISGRIPRSFLLFITCWPSEKRFPVWATLRPPTLQTFQKEISSCAQYSLWKILSIRRKSGGRTLNICLVIQYACSCFTDMGCIGSLLDIGSGRSSKGLTRIGGRMEAQNKARTKRRPARKRQAPTRKQGRTQNGRLGTKREPKLTRGIACDCC